MAECEQKIERTEYGEIYTWLCGRPAAVRMEAPKPVGEMRLCRRHAAAWRRKNLPGIVFHEANHG